MEPLRPETRRKILDRTPDAAAELDEYERLLAERFARDPDALREKALDDVDRRIRELHRKLFRDDD